MEKLKFNRLRTVMADKEKTGRELALDLGVGPVTVSRWSSNIQQPHIKDLFEIARALDCSVCDLLEKENPLPPK